MLNLSNRKFWKNKKVFITGHTGFKGTWLCIFLNLLGSKIYGYSLKPKKYSLFRQSNCSKILISNTYMDIKNIGQLKKKLQKSKPDIIFHLAAQPLVSQSYKDPIDTFKTNLIGTINLIESVKKIKSIKSVVIITTDKVYKIKNLKKNYMEKDELGGVDPYSASKACVEIATESYFESFFKDNSNIKISTARSGNVLGGGDYSEDRILPDIIRAINNKKKLILRNPNHIRPWQHVIEPLYGYLILAKKQYENKLKVDNNSWNFGPKNSNFLRVIQIVNKINNIKKLKGIYVRKKSFKETKVLQLSSNKSNKYLNWRSKWNLDQTLNKVLEWNDLYKKNKTARKICEKQILEYLNTK